MYSIARPTAHSNTTVVPPAASSPFLFPLLQLLSHLGRLHVHVHDHLPSIQEACRLSHAQGFTLLLAKPYSPAPLREQKQLQRQLDWLLGRLVSLVVLPGAVPLINQHPANGLRIVS